MPWHSCRVEFGDGKVPLSSQRISVSRFQQAAFCSSNAEMKCFTSREPARPRHFGTQAQKDPWRWSSSKIFQGASSAKLPMRYYQPFGRSTACKAQTLPLPLTFLHFHVLAALVFIFLSLNVAEFSGPETWPSHSPSTEERNNNDAEWHPCSTNSMVHLCSLCGKLGCSCCKRYR